MSPLYSQLIFGSLALVPVLIGLIANHYMEERDE